MNLIKTGRTVTLKRDEFYVRECSADCGCDEFDIDTWSYPQKMCEHCYDYLNMDCLYNWWFHVTPDNEPVNVSIMVGGGFIDFHEERQVMASAGVGFAESKVEAEEVAEDIFNTLCEGYWFNQEPEYPEQTIKLSWDEVREKYPNCIKEGA